MSDIAFFTSFSIARLDAAMQPFIASSLERTLFGMAQAKLLYQHYQNVCQSECWIVLREKANLLRLMWDCTGIQPQVAWRYVQALAVAETAIVLPPSTLETYGEVSLLPMSLIDNLERVEQISTSLPQMEISLDTIADQLVIEEVARSMKDFEQLLNTIEQKRGC